MTRSILVPVDGSTESKKALEFALVEFPDAEITAMHAIDPVETAYGGEYVSDAVVDAQEESSQEILAEATHIAAEYDHEIGTVSKIGQPAREIVAKAEESGTDQIVMGSRGRTGLSRILLGSVAETVVRRAPIPVTIVR